MRNVELIDNKSGNHFWFRWLAFGRQIACLVMIVIYGIYNSFGLFIVNQVKLYKKKQILGEPMRTDTVWSTLYNSFLNWIIKVYIYIYKYTSFISSAE